MHSQMGSPAPLRQAANRANNIPGQECGFPNNTTNPKILADALRRGATLPIGPYRSGVNFWTLQSFLQDMFPDDGYRRYQVFGYVPICAHWFSFCRTREGVNDHYAIERFADLIEHCFGLGSETLSTDAIIAGMVYRGLAVRRVMMQIGDPPQFGLAANIDGETSAPGDHTRLIRIDSLGRYGAVPPIPIQFGVSS